MKKSFKTIKSALDLWRVFLLKIQHISTSFEKKKQNKRIGKMFQKT